MKKYCFYIKGNRAEIYPIEHRHGVSISQEQYTEMLLALSKVISIEDFLKQRLFSCGKCRSFSVPAHPLCAVLAKLEELDPVAEIAAPCLKARTDIYPLYFELLGKPDEIIEKYLDKDDFFYEIQDELQAGDYVIENGEVYQFPYDECVFVFDEKCSCSQIMKI